MPLESQYFFKYLKVCEPTFYRQTIHSYRAFQKWDQCKWMDNIKSKVQLSRSVVSDSLQQHGLQHARLPCPSPTPRVYSNSCPLSQWCHPTISSSVIPFSSRLQSFQHQGLFKWVSSLHSGGQSNWSFSFISILPMNIQDWSPSGWTGWISLLSKGLSRVLSNTTVQTHQFFSAQLSL